MLNEKDQELLLELLLANILYVNVRTEQANPFVKKIGQPDAEKAFEILLNAVNNCAHLTPQLDGLSVENTEVTEEEVDIDEYL